MPFLSYQVSVEDAVNNAGRLIKEGNAESVKLEVNEEYIDTVYALNKASIPVVAHIGLCPQSLHVMGGYKVQGRDDAGDALLKDAHAVSNAGAFSVVLTFLEMLQARECLDLGGQEAGGLPEVLEWVFVMVAGDRRAHRNIVEIENFGGTNSTDAVSKIRETVKYL